MMDYRLRIVRDFGCSPAFNMAADLFMLSRCTTPSTVFVRFYTWNPPTVSLGYMQDPAGVLNLDLLSGLGFSWIRRPTGGRAVFHRGDLTYSCVFPLNASQMGTTIAESYAIISRCLRRGLSFAGIVTEAHDSNIDFQAVRREVKLPCFVAPNRDEIMVEGRKIAGSAQKRTETAVLQHGSIPVTSQSLELSELLCLSPSQRREQRRLLESKSTFVRAVCPGMDPMALAHHLARGFRETLSSGVLDQREWSVAERTAIVTESESESFRRTWMTRG